MSESIHIPVLLQQVIEYLDPQVGDTILDGTLGGGGYTRAISERVGSEGKVIALDQDEQAIKRFDGSFYTNIELHYGNFSELGNVISGKVLDGAVLDLGISSDQLAETERGISFANRDSPLDMRMDASEDNKLTAWGILNTWSEEEIANAIYLYGDEPKSRHIAREIVSSRGVGEMETVGDLLDAIDRAKPRRGRINPATQTFQALRIVVNNELGALERFLKEIPQYLKPGARLVVVSFHSKEDRLVKYSFRALKGEGIAQILTPKPIVPSFEESTENPRSRSAKLRALVINSI
ncbi:MAG: 16S rRNA (cytosine(1402)-N(4))-methyltransferase RsmH [Patescibacteria group bacterium]